MPPVRMAHDLTSTSPCAKVLNADASQTIAPGSARPHRLRELFMGTARSGAEQLDTLDGLRGLAVLVVVASHLSNLGMHLLPGLSLSGIGKNGVYLFFVLSAFLLTRVLLQRPLNQWSRPQQWADYVLRRVLRIWPLYLVVLLTSWVLTLRGVDGWHYRIDTAALQSHLLLREGQSVLWSIPVEFTFYLWLPLFALALAWNRHRGGTLATEAAAVIAALVAASLVWPPDATAFNDVRLGPHLPLFLCGAWAASLDLHLRNRPATGASVRGWGFAAAVVVAALALTVPSVWSLVSATPADPARSHRWFLFFGVAWSTLLLAVLHGPRLLQATFAWKPLRWVGVVSFSVYLWHMVVLDGLVYFGVQALPYAAGAVLTASLVVAAASYLAFERPWRNVRWARPRASLAERGARAGSRDTP